MSWSLSFREKDDLLCEFEIGCGAVEGIGGIDGVSDGGGRVLTDGICPVARLEGGVALT